MKFCYKLYLHRIILNSIFVILFLCCQLESKSVRVHASRRTSYTNQPVANIRRENVKFAKPTVKNSFREIDKIANKHFNSHIQIKHDNEQFQEESGSVNNHIESTFNSGFKRLRETLLPLLKDNEIPNETETTAVKFPAFFPSTSPFYKYDLSSIIKFIESSDDSDIEEFAESAIVDTISQLIGIVGIRDLRQWMGLFIGYFLLGPATVPLLWLPVSTVIMIGLLVPLFFFNPPSKFNDDEMGHDPIMPEGRQLMKMKIGKRGLFGLQESLQNLNQTEEIADSSTSSIVESCIERFSCQVSRFYRGNPVSQWLSSRFNTTKVEWAKRRMFYSNFNSSGGDNVENSKKLQPSSTTTFLQEDCSKYRCLILPSTAVRKLISFWSN